MTLDEAQERVKKSVTKILDGNNQNNQELFTAGYKELLELVKQLINTNKQ